MAKEFYELILGDLKMKELCGKFVILLRYVPYIIDEKTRYNVFLVFFLSCLKCELSMTI